MRRAVGAAVLASFAMYLRTLSHYFVSDDFLNRERNTLVTLADAFHFFSTSDVDFYRPIPRLHFGILQGLFVDQAGPWNFAGLALHALASALAALLAIDLLGPRARTAAMFAGLFFALHFIHVEAVVWASGVTSVYDAIFLFAAILWFRRARRTGSIRARTLSVIAFAGALLSKESAVVLALLLPLTTALAPITGREGRATSKWMTFPEALPYLILLVAHAVIVLPIDRGGDLSPYRMSIGANVLKNAAFFFLGNFVPLRYFELQQLWSASQPNGVDAFATFVSGMIRHPLWIAGIVAGAAAIGFAAWRGGRNAHLFLLWILAASAPYVFLGGSGERFLYVPSFGACALLGMACAWIRQHRATFPGRAAGSYAAIALLFAMQIFGNLDRQDDWLTAAKWTRGIVSRWSYLRGIDSERTIEFVGVPDRYRSAWVFRNGFSSMVRTHWQGRDYWREEERGTHQPAAMRMGVMLNPAGNVGMLPADLMPPDSSMAGGVPSGLGSP
ncbi:MAG TPA: hypothetical protein VFR10_01485 [bacterium]|nr:hypothetical protein [bacterium]